MTSRLISNTDELEKIAMKDIPLITLDSETVMCELFNRFRTHGFNGVYFFNYALTAGVLA